MVLAWWRAGVLAQHPYPAGTVSNGVDLQLAGDESDTLEITSQGIGSRLRAPFWLSGTPALDKYGKSIRQRSR